MGQKCERAEWHSSEGESNPRGFSGEAVRDPGSNVTCKGPELG